MIIKEKFTKYFLILSKYKKVFKFLRCYIIEKLFMLFLKIFCHFVWKNQFYEIRKSVLPYKFIFFHFYIFSLVFFLQIKQYKNLEFVSTRSQVGFGPGTGSECHYQFLNREPAFCTARRDSWNMKRRNHRFEQPILR